MKYGKTNLLEMLIGGSCTYETKDDLRHLLTLVAYYGNQNELSETQKDIINKTYERLLKLDALSEISGAINRLAETPELICDESIVESINNIVTTITSEFETQDNFDYYSLICYIKHKAIEAGDWPLTTD